MTNLSALGGRGGKITSLSQSGHFSDLVSPCLKMKEVEDVAQSKDLHTTHTKILYHLGSKDVRKPPVYFLYR